MKKQIPHIVNEFAREPHRAGGAVSRMHRFQLDGHDWQLKEPLTDSVGFTSLTAREWVYGRLACALGLPAAEMRLIAPTGNAREQLNPEFVQRVYTATRIYKFESDANWCDLNERRRAAMLCWSNATTPERWDNTGWGDKLRRPGPRDVFLMRSNSSREMPHVMVDFEGSERAWVASQSNSELRTDWLSPDQIVQQMALVNVSPTTLRQVAQEAVTIVCERWSWVVAGVEHLDVLPPARLRQTMHTLLLRTITGVPE